MAYYSEEETKELEKQLKRWKKRQLTAVRQNNIDLAFEKMSEWERSIWEMVAKADTHKDINYYAWNLAESVITKYCKLAR